MLFPGQKRGSCGHAMARFDGHSFCACCRDKGKGEEPCIANKETADCKFCNSLTPEQYMQLATPSYKIKKEKREAKRADSNPRDDSSLVDPATVSVIGAVGTSSSAQASSAPRKRNPRRIRFQPRLRNLLNRRLLIPKSPSWMKNGRNVLTSWKPSYWPNPSNRPFLQRFVFHLHTLLHQESLKTQNPFFQLTNRPVDMSPVKRTGPDTDAALQRSAGKLHADKDTHGQVSSERTGPDIHGLQHQSAGKLKSDPIRPRTFSSRCTGPDTVAKHQSTGKPVSDRHPPDSVPSDSDRAVSKQLSASKLATDRPSSH